MPTSRTEAFSDAVFAVAITLLVFNVQPPHAGNGHLGEALKALWPTYVTYVVSFLTIGIMWVNHHAIFEHIKDVDRPLLFLNLFLLMVVAFIPFPTELLGEHIQAGQDAGIAAAFYGAVMTVMSIAFSAVWVYAATHPRLLSSHLDPGEVRSTIPRFGAGLAIYALSSGVAFISAKVSLALYAAIAVFYVFNQIQLPTARENVRTQTGKERTL